MARVVGAGVSFYMGKERQEGLWIGDAAVQWEKRWTDISVDGYVEEIMRKT